MTGGEGGEGVTRRDWGWEGDDEAVRGMGQRSKADLDSWLYYQIYVITAKLVLCVVYKIKHELSQLSLRVFKQSCEQF